MKKENKLKYAINLMFILYFVILIIERVVSLFLSIKNGINILYKAYHNENIKNEELENKNILRVKDWNDIEKKVLKKSIYK